MRDQFHSDRAAAAAAASQQVCSFQIRRWRRPCSEAGARETSKLEASFDVSLQLLAVMKDKTFALLGGGLPPAETQTRSLIMGQLFAALARWCNSRGPKQWRRALIVGVVTDRLVPSALIALDVNGQAQAFVLARRAAFGVISGRRCLAGLVLGSGGVVRHEDGGLADGRPAARAG